MHHLNRVLIVTVTLLALVPLSTGVLLLGDVLPQTPADLREALLQAQDTARQGAAVAAFGDESEKAYREAMSAVQKTAQKNREIRLQIAAVLKRIGGLGSAHDALLQNEEFTMQTYAQQQQTFSDFLRYMDARQFAVESASIGETVLRRLLGFSLGAAVDADLRDAALARARTQILERLLIAHASDALSRDQLHASAGDLGVALHDLEQQHESLRLEYGRELAVLDQAESNRAASAAELARIQSQQSEVEADILSMQSELDRIDGRLRAKAERELVQKGLMKDSPDRFKQGAMVGKGEFFWPVSGPVTAGFHDASYLQFFGVPHQGIDIAVQYGSPVAAAADGIVFIVRLGGQKGYTYVMIGHRGGYATVYGHLSEVSVRAGDTVSAGEVIGLSGGLPGTEGAGPMTTGPHLHFEVILRGQHVDPKTVLP